MNTVGTVKPWNGGPRWTTLHDILRPIAAKGFSAFGMALSRIQDQIKAPHLDEEGKKGLRTIVETMIVEFERLGLVQSVIYARRIKEDIDRLAGNEVEERFKILEERMYDELDSITVLWVSQREAGFFEKTELFGALFKKQFPAANGEVIEAGNCFALGRYTACVFHLMRATEKGVLALFSALQLPPLSQPTWSWGSVLRQIDEEIKRRNKTMASDPTWIADKEFFEQAYAFLHSVKNPIRNSTMHVASTYDEAGAENVFNAIKSFLSHLAAKLKEAP